MSTSHTPSLIKRYSSSRYSRSFGRESSSSSPGGEHGSYWPADSASRRSRLSSTTSREGGGTSAAPATRQLGSGGVATPTYTPGAGAGIGDSATPPGDADDIRSFLGLIDSRAQLPSGSILLRGPSAGSSLGSSPSSHANRITLEEKMKSMADSVFRDAPVQQRRSPAPSGASGISAAMRIAAQQQAHSRGGSSGNSPTSFPPISSRQTPSPDLQLPSPIEGAEGSSSRPPFLSSGSVRQRASQVPISTSIPEEDLPAALGSESGSLGPSASGSGHFPFPRYVSSSMRRRGSNNSATSGGGGSSRPSILPSPIATAASSAIMPSSIAATAAVQEQTAQDSRRSIDSTGSGYSPRPTEDAEEQTMGQLDLGSASDVRQ